MSRIFTLFDRSICFLFSLASSTRSIGRVALTSSERRFRCWSRRFFCSRMFVVAVRFDRRIDSICRSIFRTKIQVERKENRSRNWPSIDDRSARRETSMIRPRKQLNRRSSLGTTNESEEEFLDARLNCSVGFSFKDNNNFISFNERKRRTWRSTIVSSWFSVRRDETKPSSTEFLVRSSFGNSIRSAMKLVDLGRRTRLSLSVSTIRNRGARRPVSDRSINSDESNSSSTLNWSIEIRRSCAAELSLEKFLSRRDDDSINEIFRSTEIGLTKLKSRWRIDGRWTVDRSIFVGRTISDL